MAGIKKPGDDKELTDERKIVDLQERRKPADEHIDTITSCLKQGIDVIHTDLARQKYVTQSSTPPKFGTGARVTSLKGRAAGGSASNVIKFVPKKKPVKRSSPKRPIIHNEDLMPVKKEITSIDGGVRSTVNIAAIKDAEESAIRRGHEEILKVFRLIKHTFPPPQNPPPGVNAAEFYQSLLARRMEAAVQKFRDLRSVFDNEGQVLLGDDVSPDDPRLKMMVTSILISIWQDGFKNHVSPERVRSMVNLLTDKDPIWNKIIGLLVEWERNNV